MRQPCMEEQTDNMKFLVWQLHRTLPDDHDDYGTQVYLNSDRMRQKDAIIISTLILLVEAEQGRQEEIDDRCSSYTFNGIFYTPLKNGRRSRIFSN